ncbi:uncharacterized protein HD556DRAFT_1440548 [Suillus plorans]|uniref:DUF6533 domain-containing protein n=1 Tax=Suillus plorans TaxID=116603 RepID=A0A9P7DM21_9AGAM|nr:uncharacterized protein HD556DRAFT_1440548 [Suillus plorans]KAG1798212.1 hypothetical protein HD556DRAFT_1440548 [Suillus plorans]
MTLVPNDPNLWHVININANRTSSYFVVVASTGVVYDSALKFTQEVDLVWRQRWSLMTVLYLGLRYIMIVYAVISILSYIMYFALCWIVVIVPAMLGVIMIARLYAMYQGSRKMLIFLVIIFLIVNVSGAVIIGMMLRHISVEEAILSGMYQCTIMLEGDGALLCTMYLMLITIWEILVLCLAGWVSVRHFRELRRHSAGGMIGDCFTVLMKSHIVYFASFVAVSGPSFGYLSPMVSTALYSLENPIYLGVLQIFVLMQLSVLGPRLILDVREYHAKLVDNSDATSGMTSIVFQERVHLTTSSSV